MNYSLIIIKCHPKVCQVQQSVKENVNFRENDHYVDAFCYLKVLNEPGMNDLQSGLSEDHSSKLQKLLWTYLTTRAYNTQQNSNPELGTPSFCVHLVVVFKLSW